MTDRRPDHESLVEKYLKTYLSLEVQDSDSAPTDAQLASIIVHLADRISRSSTGTIVDVGCGRGPLLSRLLELEIFSQRNSWNYIGIDTDENLDLVQSIARKHLANRRTELLNLETFYTNWPHLGHPEIIVCRNVLHELTIADTASLIRHVANNATATTELIIQDLMRLPKGERHSACWFPEELENCVFSHGFQKVQFIAQANRTGNCWFNLIATDCDATSIPITDSKDIVCQSRLRQWEVWTTLEQEFTQNLPGRGKLIDALDVDLQLAALTRQLRSEGLFQLALDPTVARRVQASELTKKLAALTAGELSPRSLVESYPHFRERGEQLTVLEEFLRSTGRLAIIYGGVGTGKTTLARRLVATRAYNKAAVLFDGRVTRGFWPFMELLFSQLGLNLAPDLLSVLDRLTPKSIEPALRNLFSAHSGSLILVIDNFQDLLNSNGVISDPDLASFFKMVLGKDDAKIILSSRSDIIPAELQRAAGGTPISVRVGRYSRDETVVNILDDHFDRSTAGIESYPARLLSAIDRHPLITSLAAQILRKWGKSVLRDDQFIAELQNRLRDQLWNRLVDSSAYGVVKVASQLRVPVPDAFLSKLAPAESIAAARESEIIYPIADSRWNQLWGLLGLFRLRRVSDPVIDEGDQSEIPAAPDGDLDEHIDNDSEHIDHYRLAALYRVIYRDDDDPKWIRESYFHLLLARGSANERLGSTLGRYYFDELIASAEYLFGKREYVGTLELLDSAINFGKLPELPSMRRASCLIRVQRRNEGEEAYRKLLKEYKDNRGIRTSHVDALLYLFEFDAARRTLLEYDLKPHDTLWIGYQWGRTFLGLNRYGEAIPLFEELVRGRDPSPHFFVHHARALELSGALGSAIKTLRDGIRRFPGDVGILTELGVCLEQEGNAIDALDILDTQFEEKPHNVKAALSIIRIAVRRGHLARAREVLRKAEDNAPVRLSSFLVAARAAIMAGESRPDLAADYLLSEMHSDPMLLAAYLQIQYDSAMLDESSQDRQSILTAAMNVTVPDNLNENAPVQLARARIAIAAGRQDLFDEALENLNHTSVDATTLRELGDQWT